MPPRRTVKLREAEEELRDVRAGESRRLERMELDLQKARLEGSDLAREIAAAEAWLGQARESGIPSWVIDAEANLARLRLEQQENTLDQRDLEDELTDARENGTDELAEGPRCRPYGT